MKIKYYIDMDGVLAKWNSRVSIEDTFKKGYFLNVEPDQLAINYVTELINRGEDVCVLSHAYQNGYAESEKKQWLIDNGLGNIPCIFVPYGMPKLNFVTLFPDTTNILIDDFSKNLHEWEEIKNNIGIKYYNGINGNHGTWKGNCINPELAPMRNKDEWEVVPECDDFDTGQHNEWSKKVDGGWWYIDRLPDESFGVFTFAESHEPIYTCKSLAYAKDWADNAIDDYLLSLEEEIEM